jgi:hypothetical protein
MKLDTFETPFNYIKNFAFVGQNIKKKTLDLSLTRTRPKIFIQFQYNTTTTTTIATLEQKLNMFIISNRSKNLKKSFDIK